MKEAFFIYLQLVTFLYYANCSSTQTGQCSESDGNPVTTDEDEITEALKKCAVSVTNLTKYFDSCFKDYEVCLTDLECLKNKNCLKSKKCKTPEDDLGTTVGTEELSEHIGKLLDVCDVNATQLAATINSCMESQLCLTDDLKKTIYQNISFHMCNLSNGFFRVSSEILQTVTAETSARETQCTITTESYENEATSSDKRKKIEDCRINATSVCEHLEQCIEEHHSLPESLKDCGIYPTQLMNDSVDCVEKIECLTPERYIFWRVNTSTHLFHISSGFEHLSMAFWGISEEYGADKRGPDGNNRGQNSNNKRKNNKRKGKKGKDDWKCELKYVPLNTTTASFDKKEFFAKYKDKAYQAKQLVNDNI